MKDALHLCQNPSGCGNTATVVLVNTVSPRAKRRYRCAACAAGEIEMMREAGFGANVRAESLLSLFSPIAADRGGEGSLVESKPPRKQKPPVVVSFVDTRHHNLTGYMFFWAKYVQGFDPREHCAKCLLGSWSAQIRMEMRMNTAYIMSEVHPASYRYIYLCGVAPVKDAGVQIAMEVSPGEEFEEMTYNNIRIRVQGARRLLFPKLARNFHGMGPAYTTCMNYQFGVQYFGMGA